MEAAGEGLVETASDASSSTTSATSSQEFLDGIESATSSQEFLDHLETLFPGPTETASDASSSTTSATSSQEFLDGMPDEIRERIFTVHTEPPEDDTEAASDASSSTTSATSSQEFLVVMPDEPPEDDTEAAEDDWPFSEWPIPEASSDELRRMLPLDMIDNHAVVFCALHRPDGRPCVLFIIPINQDSMADQGQTIVDSIQKWLQEHDSSPRDPNVYVTTCLPHRAVLNHGAQFDMRMSETDWLLKIYKKMCAGLSTASAGNAEAGEDILRSTRSPSSDRRAREALQRAAMKRREQERKDRDMAEAFRLAGVRDQEQRAAEAAAKKRAAAAAVTKIQAAAAAAAKEERQAAAAAAAKEEQREASRAGQRGITRTDSAQARFEENSGADANAKRIADSAARKQAEKEDKKRKREEQLAKDAKKNKKKKTRPPAAGGGGD